MAKIILHTPIKDEDIKNLKIGDIVYLTGHITTCRDVAHRRLIEEKENFPLTSKAGPSSCRADCPPHCRRKGSLRNGLHWTDDFHANGKFEKASSRKRASS